MLADGKPLNAAALQDGATKFAVRDFAGEERQIGIGPMSQSQTIIQSKPAAKTKLGA